VAARWLERQYISKDHSEERMTLTFLGSAVIGGPFSGVNGSKDDSE